METPQLPRIWAHIRERYWPAEKGKARLTVEEGEGSEAGEGGHVQLHLLQAGRQLQDPVQPITERGAHLIPGLTNGCLSSVTFLIR